MTTAVFHVTAINKQSTSAQLTGTTGAMSLIKLTIYLSGPNNRNIQENLHNGAIIVSPTELSAVEAASAPFDLTLTGTEANGVFTVQTMSVNTLAPNIARLESNVHELAGTAAAIDERLAHDLSGDIVGELRKLNRRVESIERLLMEARDGVGGLRATGTDPR